MAKKGEKPKSERSAVEQFINVAGTLFVGCLGAGMGAAAGLLTQTLFFQQEKPMIQRAVIYVPAITAGIIGLKLGYNP